MATVRVSPNEVQVDKLIYVFTDPLDADNFESCIATTGDVSHCAKEQITISRRPADPGEMMKEEEPVLPIENYERDQAANHVLASDPAARLQ